MAARPPMLSWEVHAEDARDQRRHYQDRPPSGDLLAHHGEVDAKEAGKQIPKAIELLSHAPDTVSILGQDHTGLDVCALEEVIERVGQRFYGLVQLDHHAGRACIRRETPGLPSKTALSACVTSPSRFSTA